ncbi:MAG: hypothetical protein AAGE93_10650 [Bacteroidota bacterium]
MKKEVGAIVSVLKPVGDTRMYEKMAQSLVCDGKFSVNILGFSSNTHPSSPDIKFHPIFRFKSQQITRLLANLQMIGSLLKIKPDFIIVTTPELAPSVLLFKLIFSRVQLFYDMQENHSRNILHHHQRRGKLRKWLAKGITFLEHWLAQKSACLFVAEKGYFQEKPWLAKFPTLLLENKVMLSDDSSFSTQGESIRLVYTGTISSIYGIWDALRFADQLYSALEGKLQFALIGHVTQLDTYQKLLRFLPDKSWITYNVQLYPIQHAVLLQAMREADFGIVSHQVLPSTENCFPTRIWEYMNYQLPFFLQNHAPWVDYCQPWECAIPIDFSEPEWPMNQIIDKMKDTQFYPHGKPSEIFWEGKKFVSVVEQALL